MSIQHKKVYICDHCGNLALYEKYPDGQPYFPDGWKKLGKKQRLCPSCAMTWKRFNNIIKEEISKE